MSDTEHGAEDRTEAATQKRLEQAREAGQLPISRDLTMLAALAGAAAGGVTLAPAAMRRLAEQAADILGGLDRIRLEDAALFGMTGVLAAAALLVGAVALPAAACGIGCGLLQTGFYIGGAPLRVQPARISPAAGLARLVSWRHLLDFLKSCARLGVLALLIRGVLGGDQRDTMAATGASAAALLPVALARAEALARPLLVVLAILAALDVFLARFQHARAMRMTREQVRLEMRETDGDPFIKAKFKRLRQQRARRRMMAQVKSAAVVITNPTHYAVALAYQRGGNTAPRVVAKGSDLVAGRIRAEAQAHGVPIVPNPPLARALFQVDLDQEIPAEHYRAVAEVIAYVWKLRARLGGFFASPP